MGLRHYNLQGSWGFKSLSGVYEVRVRRGSALRAERMGCLSYGGGGGSFLLNARSGDGLGLKVSGSRFSFWVWGLAR